MKSSKKPNRTAKSTPKPQDKREPYKPKTTAEIVRGVYERVPKLQAAMGLPRKDFFNLLEFYQKWVEDPDQPRKSLEEQVKDMKMLVESGRVSLEGLRKTELI